MLNEKMGSFVPKTDLNNLYGLVIPSAGHSFFDALMDLLDNCFDALATDMKIETMLDNDGKLVGWCIADNGTGMDLGTLQKALTYSAGSIHKPGDLGKFSIGGTTACGTIGEYRTVFTKTETGSLLVGEQDYTDVTNKTKIRLATEDEISWFKTEVGETGTIILITNLRRQKQSFSRVGDYVNRIIKEVAKVFYCRLDKDHKIVVKNGLKQRNINPVDPLYSTTEPEKVKGSIMTSIIQYQGHDISIRMVEIDADTTSHQERAYDLSGLYLCRNDRLIGPAISIKGVWNRSTRTNLGRVEISFTEALDEAFGVTNIKNKVDPEQSLVDKLSEVIKPFYKYLNESHNAPKKTMENLEEVESKFNSTIYSKLSDLLPISSTGKARKPKRKTGTNPKGAGKGSPRAAKPRALPKYRHVSMPRVLDPWWTEYNRSGDSIELEVVINQGNKFIEDYYVNGTEREQKMILILALSECLTRGDFDDDRLDSIDAFVVNKAKRVGEVYKRYSK